MAVAVNWGRFCVCIETGRGVLFVCILIIRGVLFWVYIKGLDVCKLPHELRSTILANRKDMDPASGV